MLLKNFCESFEFRIVGGSEYQWQCYGPDARFLDFESEHAHGSCIFDTVTQEIFESQVHSKDENVRPYRWLNPDFKDDYLAECEEKSIDHTQAWDSVKWTDLEVVEDFLEKANAIFNGNSFDDRVQVPLNFDDKEMLQLALEAHKRDMTINQFVAMLLQQAIDNAKEKNGTA